ncbi:MAG: hypothetical protein WKF61_12925, partial [Luteimonas sp.]
MHDTTPSLDAEHGVAAPGEDQAAPAVIRYARRAEAPPAQYWRRWTGDISTVAESANEIQQQQAGTAQPPPPVDLTGPYQLVGQRDRRHP